MENRWVAAISAHDTAAVQSLLADNYIGVTSTGRMVTKSGLLAEIKKDKNTYESVTNSRLDIRGHGDDTAVVVGTTRQKGKTPEGTAFDFTYRWTDTWAQRGGQWQCIASQSALVQR